MREKGKELVAEGVARCEESFGVYPIKHLRHGVAFMGVLLVSLVPKWWHFSGHRFLIVLFSTEDQTLQNPCL